MRVIAGQYKGRRLRAPDGFHVRPTSDRVKEALFSILGARIVGARVLDLYAGSGALGIEALSRGAASVTFVDDHPASVTCLRQNLSLCGVTQPVHITTGRVDRFVRKPSHAAASDGYDVLLADPPYDAVPEVADWANHLPERYLREDAVAALEHGVKTAPPTRIGTLPLHRTYTYGDTAVTIYRRPEPRDEVAT
ncbi:MAG: 16S rRNA (guanine(966)-N(2))-methyltransferase RsmD [Nitrospiraceae bacterium]